jgi:hypothetical protein
MCETLMAGRDGATGTLTMNGGHVVCSTARMPSCTSGATAVTVPPSLGAVFSHDQDPERT